VSAATKKASETAVLSLAQLLAQQPATPPASWIARLATTSFAFMLVWVPEPV